MPNGFAVRVQRCKQLLILTHTSSMARTCDASYSRACLRPGRLVAVWASASARTCQRPARISVRRVAQCRAEKCPPCHCTQAATASTAIEQRSEESVLAVKPDEYGDLGQRIEALASEVKERLEGTCVYLVGMMGSGKSTVGRLVGGALKYPFLDTDSLIEASAGCSIPEIFEKEGEDSFRELETQILQELMPFKEVVVATGGGAVVRPENWGYLHHGIVVWLTGTPELLARRALRDGVAQRPMLAPIEGALQEDDEYRATVTRIQALLEERGPRYSAADLHVSLAAEPDGAEDAGAPAAVVAWRLLHALNERLREDAAEREATSKAEITITREGLPPSTRTVPPAAQEGAAPAA